jgi:hypothetical protein
MLNNISYLFTRIFPIIYEQDSTTAAIITDKSTSGTPLVVLISTMIMKMLFYPGYTIHEKATDSTTWCSGIMYYNQDFDDIASYDKNRTVVLKMLQSYLSQPCFCMPDDILTHSNMQYACVCTPINKYIKVLTFSLFNIIIKEKHKNSVYIVNSL